MARIAGVNLPVHKHVWVGLQSIYGIGRSRSKKVCEAAGVKSTTKIKDLAEAEVEKLRHEIEVTRDQLRIQQRLEVRHGTQRARQHRLVGMRPRLHRAVPVANELLEVLITDFGAVDVLVTGGDERGDSVHGNALVVCLGPLLPLRSGGSCPQG